MDVSSQTENRTGNNLDSRTQIENIFRANPTIGPGIVGDRLVALNQGQATPLSGMYSNGYKRDYRNFLNGSVRLDHDLDFITKGLAIHSTVAYQNFNSQFLVNSKPIQQGIPGNVITYLALQLPNNEVVYLPQANDAPYNFSESIDKKSSYHGRTWH